MCGRHSLICIDDLGNRFRVFEPTLGCKSHFNVAPSQMMPIIVQREHVEMIMMQWGLMPNGVKNPQESMHPINARAETLAERSMFRNLLKKNRCLVPASGFYEWKKEGTRKIPFYIHLKKSQIFAFAGLYDNWTDTTGMFHPTYTIITTDANKLVAPLHNRMPVIIKREDEERWLSGDTLTQQQMIEILRPYPSEEMETYAVSSRVNTPDVDDEKLIKPLETL